MSVQSVMYLQRMHVIHMFAISSSKFQLMLKFLNIAPLSLARIPTNAICVIIFTEFQVAVVFLYGICYPREMIRVGIGQTLICF